MICRVFSERGHIATMDAALWFTVEFYENENESADEILDGIKGFPKAIISFGDTNDDGTTILTIDGDARLPVADIRLEREMNNDE